MRRHFFAGIAIGAVVLMVGVRSTAQQSQDVALRAAIEIETVKGDLKSAIDAYKKLADSSNKAVAAKALLRLAGCYEKLGDAQATKIYEQLVRDFSAQPEAAAARAKVAGASVQTDLPGPFRVRSPDSRLGFDSIPSPDGKQAIEIDAPNERLLVRDLASGRTQVILALDVDPNSASDSPGLPWSRDGRRLGGRRAIWSPDGRRIAFTLSFKNDGHTELEVASSSADVRTIARSPVHVWPLAWTTKEEVLYQSTSGFFMVSATGGEPRQVLQNVTAWPNDTVAGPEASQFWDLTPDGLSAVVIRSDHLALVEVATGDERALTLSVGVAVPKISPDGRLVAFASKQTGSWALYVAPLDRSPIRNPIRVSNLDVGDPTKLFAPKTRWTGDGVLTCEYEANENNVYRIDVDPRTARPLGAPERLTHETWTAARGIAISPDSRHIAFTPSDGGLVVMDSDGGHPRRLAEDTMHPRFGGPPQAWRSSNEVLFVKFDSSPKWISLANTSTGSIAPLASSIDPSAASKWQYIAASNEILYTAKAYSESIVAHALASGTDSVAWSLANRRDWLAAPDGQLIAYTVQSEGQPYSLRVVGRDGSAGRTVLTWPKGADPSATPGLGAWAPDGSHLLYSDDSGGTPRVLDVKTGVAWSLLGAAPNGSFLGREVGLEWFDGTWSPDRSFVVFILNTSQIRRLAFEGVTYDAVAKLMNGR